MDNLNINEIYEKEVRSKLLGKRWDKFYIVAKSSEVGSALAVQVEEVTMETKASDIEVWGGWGNSAISPAKGKQILFSATIKTSDKPANIQLIELPAKEITESEFLELVNVNLEGEKTNEH